MVVKTGWSGGVWYWLYALVGSWIQKGGNGTEEEGKGSCCKNEEKGNEAALPQSRLFFMALWTVYGNACVWTLNDATWLRWMKRRETSPPKVPQKILIHVPSLMISLPQKPMQWMIIQNRFLQKNCTLRLRCLDVVYRFGNLQHVSKSSMVWISTGL